MFSLTLRRVVALLAALIAASAGIAQAAEPSKAAGTRDAAAAKKDTAAKSSTAGKRLDFAPTAPVKATVLPQSSSPVAAPMTEPHGSKGGSHCHSSASDA